MWVGVDWFFDWRAMGTEIAKHKYILIGMTTFVLLIPLALTSTKGSVRRLGGARWARLHRLIYLCAITGTVHYLWAVKKDTLFPLVYLFVFVLLLGFRLWDRYIGPMRLRGRRAPRMGKRPSVLTDVTAPKTRALGGAQ
jgi:sulfoxide reductase heme-binding subunit YedZ